MANYIELTLDTIAPGGVSVIINDGEAKTDLASVRLAIACSDADLTGYQMKIWGIDGAKTEDFAMWESFSATKDVTLPVGDGVKTVYVKVRDDVWNESVIACDTIGFYTAVPTVEMIDVNFSKLSLVTGRRQLMFGLTYSEDVDAVKIMIVNDVNASYDDSSNISIPATNNGSAIKLETSIGTRNLQSDYMEFTDVECDSSIGLKVNLMSEDILSASPGEGVKILKTFVRSALSGNWSE